MANSMLLFCVNMTFSYHLEVIIQSFGYFHISSVLCVQVYCFRFIQYIGSLSVWNDNLGLQLLQSRMGFFMD